MISKIMNDEIYPWNYDNDILERIKKNNGRICSDINIIFSNDKDYTTKGIDVNDFYYDSEFDSFSEREQKAIDFIKPLTENVRYYSTTYYKILFDTYARLRLWGMSEDVCLAGLFHNVFGNEKFKPKLDITEEQVRELIGDYALGMVKTFCKDKHVARCFQSGDLDLTRLLYAQLIADNRIRNLDDGARLCISVKNRIEGLENN